jgi:trimeric autotransporter adhesin
MLRHISLLLVISFASWSQGSDAYRVSTYAGTPRLAEIAATDLTLNTPIGLARDSQGNLYVADFGNHRIFKVTPAGRATVIAGTGVGGYSGNGGPALSAQLQNPRALALDGDKYLYVGEPSGYRVRRIDLNTGIITLVLGDGQARYNGDGNPGPNTSINEVLGLAVDSQGNLIVADTGNHRIRKVSASDGRVSTIAGTGTAGLSGDGGAPTSAQLNRPGALALAANGDLYFSELGNGRIRKISGGVVNTIAGLPTATARTGPALQVRIVTCIGLVLNAAGTALYFTDEDTDTVRMLDLSSLQVSAVGGTGTQAYSGDNGPAAQAALANPNHIVLNEGVLTFADASNNRIRQISATGQIATVVGGKPFTSGDGGPASQATFGRPSMLKIDSSGNLIVTDPASCVVRRIDISGHTVTIAGLTGTCQLSGLTAATADSKGNVYWVTPQGLFVKGPTDVQGRSRVALAFSDILLSHDEKVIYLLESTPANARIWTVDPTAVAGQGTVLTGIYAGSGLGSGGDGGTALKSVFFIPQALAEDTAGNLYVLDIGNRNVRRVDKQNGTISTVATSQFFASGKGLTIDSANTVIVTAGHQLGTFAGGKTDAVVGSGKAGFTADGIDGLLAQFDTPSGVAVSSNGTVYVADSGNQVLRRLSPVKAVSLQAQSARASTSGTIPAQVLVMGSDRAPLDGITVAFSVTPASATLSAATAVTDSHGIASVDVTLGGAPAVVTATVADLTPVSIDVTSSASGAKGTLNQPTITAAISLSQFGGAKKIAPAGWVEIYGSNLAVNTVQWAASDFQNNQAPLVLDGVHVTMNGAAAFLNLVSPGQINCIAPDGIGSGDVLIVVSNANGTSEAFHVAGAARVPSLLAPSSFTGSGHQYVAALFPDGAFVGPEGLIAGAAFRPAAAGDRVVLYGVGFGATNPATPAGQIAGQAATLANLEIKFGGVPAIVEYGGPAGGYVGLYQFNVVTPAGISGDVRLTITVDGAPVEQDLWIAVK